MEFIVLKCLKGNVIIRFFDNLRLMMMDCFENGIVKVENQWGIFVVEVDILMLQFMLLFVLFIILFLLILFILLFVFFLLFLLLLLFMLLVIFLLCDDVLLEVNLMVGCFQVQQILSKLMLIKEFVEDVGGYDLMNEFSFDLQDIILLDFVEELFEQDLYFISK